MTRAQLAVLPVGTITCALSSWSRSDAAPWSIWNAGSQASAAGAASPQFDEQCRQCGKRVFKGVRLHEGPGVSVWSVRAYALEELQRMNRNGTRLRDHGWTAPVVLKSPRYWELMLPPPSGQTSTFEKPPTDERPYPLVPVDLYFESSNDPKVVFKQKLRIVLQNASDREVIVQKPTWNPEAGDIPARPHPLNWSIESDQGWTSKKWRPEGVAELIVRPGQVFGTWIGLTQDADENEVRRRAVIRRLGTLVVPLAIDGQTETQKIRL